MLPGPTLIGDLGGVISKSSYGWGNLIFSRNSLSYVNFQYVCIHLVHRFQHSFLRFWNRSGAPRQFLPISRRLGRPEPARLGKSEKSQSRAGPAGDFERFSKNFGDFGRISGRPAVQILELSLIFFRFSMISIEKPIGIQAGGPQNPPFLQK